MRTYLDLDQGDRDCWPNMEIDNHHETSKKCLHYNCIAWALGVENDRWAPYTNYTWFNGFPKFDLVDFPQKDIDSYKLGFESIGYEVCQNEELENGYEKIAIYISGQHVEHIAKQLENGNWTSKLGKLHDIEHYNLKVLEGNCYGQANIIMKRKKPNKFLQKLVVIKNNILKPKKPE